jgi:hypothetical protein
MNAFIANAISQTNFSILNRSMAKAWGVHEAYIYSYFVSSYLYFQSRNQIKDGDWFYCTDSKLEDELGMKRSPRESSIKHLIELGVLERARFERSPGQPRVNHYRFPQAADAIIMAVVSGAKSRPISFEDDGFDDNECDFVGSKTYCRKPTVATVENRQYLLSKTDSSYCRKPTVYNNNDINNKESKKECVSAHTHTHTREPEFFAKSEHQSDETQNIALDAKKQDETTQHPQTQIKCNHGAKIGQICEDSVYKSPAEKNIEHLKAELEKEKEQIQVQKNDMLAICFNDNATPRFRDAIMSYIEIANQTQYNTYPARRAQSLVDSMQAYAEVDFASYVPVREIGANIYDAIAFAIEQSNLAKNQWNLKRELVKDLVKRYCENEKTAHGGAKPDGGRGFPGTNKNAWIHDRAGQRTGFNFGCQEVN